MLNEIGRSSFQSKRNMAAMLLVLGCLHSLQPSIADDRSVGAPRKEGKWDVTPIGGGHDRVFWAELANHHLLFIAVDHEPGQLWNTQTGKRVAILANQKNGVDSYALSPDGTMLITADRLGGWRYFRDETDEKRKVVSQLWLWELKTGKFLKRIEVDLSAEELRDSADWKVEWLGKEKVLIQLDCRRNPARASFRTILGLLDLGTEKVVRWSELISTGESLQCSPDGKRAVTGCEYGAWRQEGGEIAWGGRGTTTEVGLLDLVNLKPIVLLDKRKPGDRDRSILGRYWSKDSRWIATVGSDDVIGIWAGDSGKPVSSIKGHNGCILDVAFSPDGKTLVTASNDETARLWDTAKGNQMRVFEGHTAGLNCAAFDSKGLLVLTGGEDETARLWNVADGKQVRVWGEHESAVRSVGFEKDDKTIWTRTVQGVRRTWKIEDGSLLAERKSTSTDHNRVGALYLKRTKKDGYEIWSGPPGVPGEGREDAPPELRPKFNMKGDSRFWASAISADGKTAASKGKDRSVSLWDLARWDKVTGEGRTFLPAQESEIRRLAFTPEGNSLAVAYDDGSVRLWDTVRKKEILKFEGGARHVRGLVFSPDGTMLAGGSWERRLYLWKVATGKTMMMKEDGLGPLHAVAFSPDSKTLASAGMVKDPDGKDENTLHKPGEIILWDAASGELRRRITGFRTAVDCLAFTTDGKTLIAGDFNQELSFWNVATGERRAIVKGIPDTVSYLAVSPDGKLLASAHDFSNVIELWDITSAKEIGHFHSPALSGGLPVFTSDGRTLMIASRRVQFWDVGELRKKLLPPNIPDADKGRH